MPVKARPRPKPITPISEPCMLDRLNDRHTKPIIALIPVVLLAQWWYRKFPPPTWMFSRHIPSGNKTCVRTEPKTDHNDHDLSHGYLCKKKSNLCPLCALLFRYLDDQTFLLNSNTTVFCTLSLLSSELSINHFPSQVFSHLHLLWYYGSFFWWF